jgi:hypothetical protein
LATRELGGAVRFEAELGDEVGEELVKDAFCCIKRVRYVAMGV